MIGIFTSENDYFAATASKTTLSSSIDDSEAPGVGVLKATASIMHSEFASNQQNRMQGVGVESCLSVVLNIRFMHYSKITLPSTA